MYEEEEEGKALHKEAPQELCEENQNATEVPKFLQGDIVQIDLMENLPQYNGQLGVIAEVIESTGRCLLYVNDEKEISVLLKNLTKREDLTSKFHDFIEDTQQQAMQEEEESTCQQPATQEEEESTLLHEEAPQELGEDKQNTAYARGDADTTKAKSIIPFQDFIALAPLELKKQLPENQIADLEESYNHLSPDSQDVLVHFLQREVKMKAKKGDAYDAEAARGRLVKMFAFVEKELHEEKQNTAEASGDADTTKAKSLVPFADLIAVAPLELKEQLSVNQIAELEESYNHLGPDSQDVLVSLLQNEAKMKTKKGHAYDAEAARRKMEKMFAFVAKRQADDVKKCVIM